MSYLLFLNFDGHTGSSTLQVPLEIVELLFIGHFFFYQPRQFQNESIVMESIPVGLCTALKPSMRFSIRYYTPLPF